MSVIMFDGFDTYNGIDPNLGAGTQWAIDRYNNNYPSVTMGSGRFGGQAFTVTYTGGSTACGGGSRQFSTPISTIAAGFAFRTSNRSGHAVAILPTIFAVYSTADGLWQDLLCVNVNGAISAFRASGSNSGTLLGTSADDVIQNNVWHYIEVEIDISSSAGRVKVKVDGNTVINVTGVNTLAGGSGTVDRVVLAGTNGGGATVITDFDDLYVTDNGTSLGERRVETLPPTADVVKGFVPNAGTTNCTQVDELPANGDTDYVQGTNVGDRDTYDFSNLSSNAAAVDAVQIVAYAKKTDAATRGIALQVVSGGNTFDGPTTNLPASYTKLERLMTTNPNTGGAWSYSTVNALRGGPKVTV
jgi:hypothetical protein